MISVNYTGRARVNRCGESCRPPLAWNKLKLEYILWGLRCFATTLTLTLALWRPSAHKEVWELSLGWVYYHSAITWTTVATFCTFSPVQSESNSTAHLILFISISLHEIVLWFVIFLPKRILTTCINIWAFSQWSLNISQDVVWLFLHSARTVQTSRIKTILGF